MPGTEKTNQQPRGPRKRSRQLLGAKPRDNGGAEASDSTSAPAASDGTVHDNPATREPETSLPAVTVLHAVPPITDPGNDPSSAYTSPPDFTDKQRINPEDRKTLDAAEELADDAILDDDEGDAPGDKDEINQALVVKKLPRFSVFRASPETFDLWGTSDRQGMDDLLFVTTKSFAPQFEDDVDLRRVRFFETVTNDSVVRLCWCFVPEKGGRQPNSWNTSKLAALEHAQERWTTMRSRMKLGQYTYRASAKQKEYGDPKFSGRTRQQWVMELKKQGILVDSKEHPFYKKATDSE
jgi:hypothetical protein